MSSTRRRRTVHWASVCSSSTLPRRSLFWQAWRRLEFKTAPSRITSFGKADAMHFSWSQCFLVPRAVKRVRTLQVYVPKHCKVDGEALDVPDGHIDFNGRIKGDPAVPLPSAGSEGITMVELPTRGTLATVFGRRESENA